MLATQEAERPRKKRKVGAAALNIGGRTISLDGFLNAPPPKPKPIPSASEAASEVTGTKPLIGQERTEKREKAESLIAVRPSSAKKSKYERFQRHAHHHHPHHHHQSNLKSTDDATLLKTREKLPIWKYRLEIQAALRKTGRDVLIMVGETGSGKSTQVPQFLYREDWCQRRKVKVLARESDQTRLKESIAAGSISTSAPTSSTSSTSSTAAAAAAASPISPSKEDSGGNIEDVWVGGMVAVTQPRRVAATTLAYRVAAEAGTPLDGSSQGLVGYSVRFDHRVPKGTRIKYMTEGMLLQEMLQDPNLRQYSAVVVDEIHERSIDVDLLVGFLKQILQGDGRGRGGVPLKVVVMSATADVDVISEFFKDATSKRESEGGQAKGDDEEGVKVLRIQGRQHPVTITHLPRPVADIQATLLKTIFQTHLQEPLPGDILAFLTGQEEIESVQKLIEEYAGTLASNAPKLRVLPLYGQLSIEAQHQAFQPVKEALTRKVVLATNIAETSVTVPGVRFVVDCGKVKVKQFRARLGMESLLAKPVSKSSAIQRAGRAGREAPGKCCRLYTAESFAELPSADLPEILRNDVVGAVLTMKARGVHDVLGFPFISVPDADSIQRALLHLHFLGGLDDHGAITRQGRQMAMFPISAPFARVLISAAAAAADAESGCVLDVVDIIACLTAGEDLFHHVNSEDADAEETEALRKELYCREGDLLTYLKTLRLYVAENADRGAWCHRRRINARNMRQALNIRRQLRVLCLRAKLLAEQPPPDPQPFAPLGPTRADAVLRCFVRGFAFRTAVLAPDASYVTVRGKHVVAVHPSSVLHGQKREAILFLEHVFTARSYAKRVSAIRASWIAEALEGSC